MIAGPPVEASEEVLTPEALRFVAELHHRFDRRRRELLAARVERRDEIGRTGRLDFLPETEEVREADWKVVEAPPALVDRRVEITGPTDAKMLINALSSGARVHMTDFEDATSPTWQNIVEGQRNVRDAVEGSLAFTAPDGRRYELADQTAVMVVRPRGWHLLERHLLAGDTSVAGGLVDFGLHLFHNARPLLEQGRGPYFYLPKLESHLEARLWNDVFVAAQEALGIPVGTIRATVLIETITAAFEMEEILFELRDHASGLNAGRWDYMFSLIKNFRDAGAEFVLPDRASVTMTAPMMRAYTELLVATCHRRGAFAIGGMAAFIPSRRDPEVNEVALAKVREDKEREAGDGFDGTWVAHPDLVPVAKEVFDRVLGARPNQLDRQRPDVSVTAEQLLDVAATPGQVTEAGVRNNVSVGVQYIESWLRGAGAVAIFNLMEDAATAEIARCQLWQWVHNEVRTESGEIITEDMVRHLLDDELETIRESLPAEEWAARRFDDARTLVESVALSDAFVEFLTIPAYDLLVEETAGR